MLSNHDAWSLRSLYAGRHAALRGVNGPRQIRFKQYALEAERRHRSLPDCWVEFLREENSDDNG